MNIEVWAIGNTWHSSTFMCFSVPNRRHHRQGIRQVLHRTPEKAIPLGFSLLIEQESPRITNGRDCFRKKNLQRLTRKGDKFETDCTDSLIIFFYLYNF